MRRTDQKRNVSGPASFISPSANKKRGAVALDPGSTDGALSSIDRNEPDSYFAPSNSHATDSTAASQESQRRRRLPTIIRQRIESRLAGRVRNLAVRLVDDTVVLDGQCATYYTKQLAQHAALGVLDDEALQNAIVVDVQH